MDTLESVKRILIHRKRLDLAELLQRARLEFDVSDTFGSYLFSLLTVAEVYAPLSDYERLKSLPEEDVEFILGVLQEVHPPKAHEMEVCSLAFRLDVNEIATEGIINEDLLHELEAQKDLMIAVATGGPRIDSVNEKYKSRRRNIQDALKDQGLADPNPYTDLWEWYGKWSSGDLPTYQSRRQYISELFANLLQRVERGSQLQGGSLFEEPTGWARVDRGLGEIRKRLEEAENEEQFQAIGLLCRETLISLARTVYNPDQHLTIDTVAPSRTDAKRMLEAYLAKELAGRINEVARRHAKAALNLANDLQHRRTASFRQAALCSEATTSVVNLVAIISGQRDP